MRTYDHARFPQPMKRVVDAAGDRSLAPISWEEGMALLVEALKKAPGKAVFLGGAETGTQDALIDQILAAIGSPHRLRFEPYAYEALRSANETRVRHRRRCRVQDRRGRRADRVRHRLHRDLALAALEPARLHRGAPERQGLRDLRRSAARPVGGQHRSVARAEPGHRGAGRDRARQRGRQAQGRRPRVAARAARQVLCERPSPSKTGIAGRVLEGVAERHRRRERAARAAARRRGPGHQRRALRRRGADPERRHRAPSARRSCSAPTTTSASSRASRSCRSWSARCAAARSACCSCTTRTPPTPRRRSASPTRCARATCSPSASRTRRTRRRSSRTWSCPTTPPSKPGATPSRCAA